MSGFIVAVTFFIGVLASVAVAPYTFRDRDELGVCETKECVTEASRILNSLDTSADPCNNFYQHACGGWIRNHPIPENEPSYNQFKWASEQNVRRLRDILDSDYSQDAGAIKKAKIYYKSCINEEAIEEIGATPALDVIQQLGGMPLFEGSQTGESFSLETYLAKTKMEKSSTIIKMEVKVDDMNSSRNIIVFDQPSLIMPSPAYYLSPDFHSVRIAYREYLQNFLEKLWKSFNQEMSGARFNRDTLNQAVEEILHLETDLAKLFVPQEERTDILKIYNRMRIRDMTREVATGFNWLKYANKILAKFGAKIDRREEVVILSKPYLSKLMTVLRKYDARTLKNYVAAHSVARYVTLLSKEFRDTEVPLRKALTGIVKEKLRWKHCTEKARRLLKMAVGALYAKTMFSRERKNMAMEMMDNIQTSFKEDLRSIQWMDDSTKTTALIKVDKVNKLIGYPDYILDDEDSAALDEEYAELEMSENEYLKSEMGIHTLQFRQSLSKLNEPVDFDQWKIGPAEVNAFYQRNFNTITFPAAVLETPFFNPGRPFAMNYGGIGNAAGHELTHGFDTSGSRYNGNGNLENWWTNFSRQNFEEESSCFEKQYGNFFYEPAGMYVNGKLTIRENIADNGGIRSAYNGYRLWRGINPGMEFHLPGLEHYSMDQLFFIAYAQVWCASERPATAKLAITRYPHSPGIFRTEGTLQNFEKFGEAFECRKGKDKLYTKAKDRCRVW